MVIEDGNVSDEPGDGNVGVELSCARSSGVRGNERVILLAQVEPAAAEAVAAAGGISFECWCVNVNVGKVVLPATAAA